MRLLLEDTGGGEASTKFYFSVRPPVLFAVLQAQGLQRDVTYHRTVSAAQSSISKQSLRSSVWASEMTRQVKVLVAKSDGLSLNSRRHRRKEKTPENCPLPATDMLLYKHT